MPWRAPVTLGAFVVGLLAAKLPLWAAWLLLVILALLAFSTLKLR